MAGITKRYRVIDQRSLLNATGFDSFSECSEWYIASVEDTIRNKHLQVDIIKNVFAYGDKEFVEIIGKLMPDKWYHIQEVTNLNYQNKQNTYMIMVSKKKGTVKKDLQITENP